MAGIILCGIQQGYDKTYRCPYCGFESNDVEDFAISMCWDCVWENKVDEPEDDEPEYEPDWNIHEKETIGELARTAPAWVFSGDGSSYPEGLRRKSES